MSSPVTSSELVFALHLRKWVALCQVQAKTTVTLLEEEKKI